MTALQRWIAHATMLALAVTGLAACGGEAERAPAAPETPVAVLAPEDVITVKLDDVAAGTTLIGSLDPYRVVDVKAQVPGTIGQLRVDRGEAVERGELLAVIEAEGIRSEAASAKARLAAMRQRLEGARKLYQAGALSEVEYRNTLAEYEAAEGQFASASESARRANVTAPITGVVSRRMVSQGEAVSIGQELLTVVNSEVLELTGQISVQAAAQVEVGQRVTFELDSYPGRVFEGTVARIDPVADPATRRVQVAVQLPNPEGALVGGQFVTGRILSAHIDDAILLPQSAVRGEPDERYVLAIENDTIVRKPIEVTDVISESGRMLVQAGLEVGDRVIVSPATDVPLGARVAISPAGMAAQQGAGP